VDALVGFGAPPVVLLWLVACATTAWWVVRQARDRSLVTIPVFVVVFWFFLPILLQYPFTFSPINAVATGVAAFDAYQDQIDRALVVSVAGMAAFAVSYAALPKGARPNSPTTFIARALSAWSHPGLLWVSSLGVILIFAFLSGAGLLGAEGMRARAMETPILRPVFNLAAVVLPVLAAVVLLAASERRKPSLWVLACLLLIPAFLTGSRGVAFGGVMTYGLTVLGYRAVRRDLNARHLVAALPIAALVLFLALYLGDVRGGQYNILVTAATMGVDLFYGNNFSDLRDFAWVLAYWDGELLGGRTQLAGLLGFIPAVFSPFRTNWRWGRVTNEIVGLDNSDVATTHPGLRTGMFGELYMNFDLVGVVLGGLLLGYLAVRLHAATRHAVDHYSPFEAKLVILGAFTALNLLSSLYISAAAFGIYVMVAVLVTLRVAKGIIGASVAAPAAGSVMPARSER